MEICENGVIREMTPAEITAMQDAAAQAEVEEKRRPLSFSEVQEMLVHQQINTLTVGDQTAATPGVGIEFTTKKMPTTRVKVLILDPKEGN